MKKSKKSIAISAVAVVLIGIAAYLFIAQPWNRPNPQGLDYIDLTSMNSNMVYAYVNDMVNNYPNDYLGKTVKAQGKLNRSYYATTQKYYSYIVISDATACCVQGIEFIYGGDYPEDDTEIVIEGTFDSYTELGITYYYINTTQLTTVG